MRPIALTMRSFGSYGNETTIRFDGLNQNLFLITGDTGAGKTTIFDAIVFALYGETGSSSNKKDGIVLQSQFTAYDREPFVELVFTEALLTDGEAGMTDAAVYKVRRVPRHLRLLTRGAGKGTNAREITGSVSLTMPDGTEYPSKETDKKLEEIVGLTKGQFMQVAMIAQGEFMELLRAKSDDKKVIFRKLFHTDLYQKIEEELANRKKEKEKEASAIRAVCQMEAVHVSVPEDYAKAADVNRLRKQMAGGEITVLDSFLEALDGLCAYLKAEQKKAENRKLEAKSQEIAKRNACINAQNLAQIYSQLEAAQKELAGYEAQKSEIDENRKQIERLRAVSEVQNVYRLYSDAKKSADASGCALSELEEVLPGQEECLRKAEENQKVQQQLFDEQQVSFAQVSERVKQALILFRKAEEAEKEIQENEAVLRAAQKGADADRKNLEHMEAQEQSWRAQEQELSGVPEQAAIRNGKEERSARLAETLGEVKKLRKREIAQEHACERARREYSRADAAYQRARARYEKLRRTYLDEQAGILAGDLKVGQPCPVCGSTEHPHPAVMMSAETGEITQELLNDLEAEAQSLADEQQKKAAASQAAIGSLTEKRESVLRELGKLCRELEETAAAVIPDMKPLHLDIRMGQTRSGGPETAGDGEPGSGEPDMEDRDLLRTGSSDDSADALIGQASDWILAWQKQLEAEKTELEQKLAQLSAVRKNLSGIDEKKQKLREKTEAADAAVTDALAKLEGSRQKQKSLADQNGSYAAKEEAVKAQKEAEQAKNRQEALSKAAVKAAKEAKENVDRTQALMKKYREELPGQQQLCAERQMDYEKCMTQKGLTEEQWQTFASAHAPEEEKELQSRIDRYTRNRTSAQSRVEAALETIDGRPKPELTAAQIELKAAEELLKSADESFTRVSEICRTNERTRKSLKTKLGERRRIVEELTRLDSLYRLVSGNVKDSRMDLETFVQRYYMERILHAANRRFLEMSGGQFELRLIHTEMAGKGKNRGLDLMVYSTVTGKEREIRTLSGGESFMAALSLALGMADQIQQSTAAIHLDMMFVDEGFGSLDDHSRNQAVRVLKEMAGGSRLIGIISHVTELKQEIDDQLLVTKDESGSHVKWQIS